MKRFMALLVPSIVLAAAMVAIAPTQQALAHTGCGGKHGLASGAVFWTNPQTGTSHHGHWAMGVEGSSDCAKIRYALQMWCDYSASHVPAGCDYDVLAVGIATKVQSGAAPTFPWGLANRHQDGGTTVTFLGSWHDRNAPAGNAPFPVMSMKGGLQWRFKVVEPDHLTQRYCQDSEWHSMIPSSYGTIFPNLAVLCSSF